MTFLSLDPCEPFTYVVLCHVIPELMWLLTSSSRGLDSLLWTLEEILLVACAYLVYFPRFIWESGTLVPTVHMTVLKRYLNDLFIYKQY
jgi:hypothetical protein